MQRTLMLDDRSFSVVEANAESFCLVCDASLDVASSTNIFYTSLPRNGELLASYVLRVLRPVASDLRSSYICSRCNQLFQMLEQAQWTVSNIKCEILKVYNSRESEMALEHKTHLSRDQILSNELFIQSDDKSVLENDRFHDIDEFRAPDVESNGNDAQSDSFHGSSNDFCTLNIGIDNDKKNSEDNLYGSKIDCLQKDLNADRDENCTRSDDFSDSTNDFCHLNIGIDNGNKELEKTLEISEKIVYRRKNNSLKTRDTEHHEEQSRIDVFDDSPDDFCNLNVGIDNNDGKIEKSVATRQNRVYESKIDCVKLSEAERDENGARNDDFTDSSTDFCNSNIRIDNADTKLDETVSNSESSVYESKIGCFKVEQSIEVSKKCEAENKIENSSGNVQDFVSSDLLINSIEGSTETVKKIDKNAQYTMQCKICPRLFKSARDLRSHSLKHGGSRPYYCHKCNERFADLSLANSHVTKIHSSNKNCITIATEPWDNEVADFTSEDSIIFEESDLNAESISNNKKTDREFLKIGRSSKYSLKPLKYPCSICGKKWRTSAELKTHIKTHSNLRPYMCEKCGQAYKHKQALEIHVGMHNGISPYQCSVCNKCFTQKGALMRHLPIHTGEMPYQCELCGKRFVHHTSYNMHALSHTGKKSYQCHVCNLSLLSTSHLKRHMRVHTGEKPYSCDLCGKSFAERYNLFAHQKIHDPAEIMAKAAKKITYKCEQCDEYFEKKQKLEEHTKDRHSSTKNEKKWLGHTVEIENPTKTSDIDQTWQDYNYSKLQSVVVGMKTTQNDNSLSQISHESIALLMSQTNHNKSLAVMMQPTNSTSNAEINQTQI